MVGARGSLKNWKKKTHTKKPTNSDNNTTKQSQKTKECHRWERERSWNILLMEVCPLWAVEWFRWEEFATLWKMSENQSAQWGAQQTVGMSLRERKSCVRAPLPDTVSSPASLVTLWDVQAVDVFFSWNKKKNVDVDFWVWYTQMHLELSCTRRKSLDF